MKTSRLFIAISVLVLSLALVTGALAAASRGTVNQTPPPPPGGLLPEGEGPWVVRAYYDDPRMVAALAQTKEPWEVNTEEGYVVVDVTAEEYLMLQWQGFHLEVDEARTKLMNQPRVRLPGQTEGIPGFPCYRTVEETYATAEQIVADYPDLASWIDIGDSWEKTQPGGLPGYDLMVLRLTNSNIPGPKPKFYAMSAIHAREYATAELNTRFAEYLVQNYGKDPDITWILDYNEVHLLLQANPDGRKIAETGDLWRKNTDNNDGCVVSSLWGTDLNRNYDFHWACCGGSDSDPCGETYHGPSAGSEPETQAVQNYASLIFPDQRPDDLTTPAPITSTGFFLDIHSYSQLVLWSWGFTANPAPNSTGLQTLGRKLAYFNNYWPEQSIGLYPTDGTTDDFTYGRLGVPAYTFEIGTDFFQDCGTFENTILPDNLQALLYGIKIPRTPYMTPAGPDSLSVLAAPVAVSPGDPVELSAQVNDTRYNNSNGSEPTQDIAAAEFYIDVPPWSENPSPVAYPMSAADGAFDEMIEDVTAAVDTSGLSTGRHMIFVRGQDVSGNWGPVSAAFLYVVDPDVAPELEGYVRDYATNAPLIATVNAGPFVAASDSITGFYHMLVVSGTYDISAIAPGHVVSTVNGLQLEDYQTTRQSFTLLPACQVFFDDVESGNQGWTAQSPWAITTEASHSPTHSWTDSPGGPYTNFRNVSLTSQVFNLTGATGTSLGFLHTYNTEAGFDFGLVEYSTNGGTSWTQAAAYSGVQANWAQVTIQLPALDGEPDARIRFRFTSDSNVTGDGWHVDDIELSGSGSSCMTPLAPTADFTSNSPVLPGEAVQFTNMTEGSNPLTYNWDFGDGQGTSTESDPQYSYVDSGTYLVTLTASNSEGSNSVTHTVVVEPCMPVTAVTMTLQTTGTLLIGQPIDFLVDVAPDEATKPYSYVMDFGDGTDPQLGFSSDDPMGLIYTYTLPGDFQAEILIQSCEVAPITDTVQLSIIGEDGFILAPSAEAKVGAPGTTVSYTLRLTNTISVSNTYDLALGGNGWTTDLSEVVIGPVAPGESQEFSVSVDIPADAAAGASDTVTVTATSQYPGILPETASLTTSASERFAMAVSAEATAITGIPGSLVTYTLNLTNTSNTTDTISIDVSGVWTTTIVVDPESAYQGGAVSLASGASAVIHVSVAVPEGISFGASDATTVSFVSAGDPLVGEEVVLTTTAGAYQVMLPLILMPE